MEHTEEPRKQVRRYTPEDRLAYQQLVGQGLTVRQAAAQLGFAVSTAAKWLHWETAESSSKTQAPMGRPRIQDETDTISYARLGPVSLLRLRQSASGPRRAGHK